MKTKLFKGLFTSGKGQTIAPGQGSGKSTIKFIDPFYDVNEGTISIDGTDIKDINLQSFVG
jgi:subfamily B ATP-binding cassette protein MsbA